MATVFITEFANWVVSPGGGTGGVPAMPIINQQNLLTSGSETKSAAFNVATKIVQLSLDSGVVRLLIGTSPTTTASTGMRLATTIPLYFGVQGSDMLLSAISAA